MMHRTLFLPLFLLATFLLGSSAATAQYLSANAGGFQFQFPSSGNGALMARTQFTSDPYEYICSSGVNTLTATVLCKMMRGPDSTKPWDTGAFYPIEPSGTNPKMILRNVHCEYSFYDFPNCDYTEDSCLSCCSSEKALGLQCFNQDVGVKSGDYYIRISKKDDRLEWRVPTVPAYTQWGSVCVRNFDHTSAVRICEFLGYKDIESDRVVFFQSANETELPGGHVTELGCNKYDSSFATCSKSSASSCASNHGDVGVRCADSGSFLGDEEGMGAGGIVGIIIGGLGGVAGGGGGAVGEGGNNCKCDCKFDCDFGAICSICGDCCGGCINGATDLLKCEFCCDKIGDMCNCCGEVMSGAWANAVSCDPSGWCSACDGCNCCRDMTDIVGSGFDTVANGLGQIGTGVADGVAGAADTVMQGGCCDVCVISDCGNYCESCLNSTSNCSHGCCRAVCSPESADRCCLNIGDCCHCISTGPNDYQLYGTSRCGRCHCCHTWEHNRKRYYLASDGRHHHYHFHMHQMHLDSLSGNPSKSRAQFGTGGDNDLSVNLMPSRTFTRELEISEMTDEELDAAIEKLRVEIKTATEPDSRRMREKRARLLDLKAERRRRKRYGNNLLPPPDPTTTAELKIEIDRAREKLRTLERYKCNTIEVDDLRARLVELEAKYQSAKTDEVPLPLGYVPADPGAVPQPLTELPPPGGPPLALGMMGGGGSVAPPPNQPHNYELDRINQEISRVQNALTIWNKPSTEQTASAIRQKKIEKLNKEMEKLQEKKRLLLEQQQQQAGQPFAIPAPVAPMAPGFATVPAAGVAVTPQDDLVLAQPEAAAPPPVAPTPGEMGTKPASVDMMEL